jgi:hypothetical protein
VRVLERVPELATGQLLVSSEEGHHHRPDRSSHSLDGGMRRQLRIDLIDQLEVELVVQDDPFLGPEIPVHATGRHIAGVCGLLDRHVLEADSERRTIRDVNWSEATRMAHRSAAIPEQRLHG